MKEIEVTLRFLGWPDSNTDEQIIELLQRIFDEETELDIEIIHKRNEPRSN